MDFPLAPPSPVQAPSPLRPFSVAEFGARGDGLSDDHEPVQRALGSGGRQILVPPGTYRLGSTLRLPSGSWIKAHPQAHFILADEAGIDSSVFLLSNSDLINGNENIRLEGGIWDGNNRRNHRGPDRPDAYTGAAFNFIHVDRLQVSHLRLHNAETYFIRAAWLSHFRFHDIVFWTNHPRPNQDGLHLAGHCHHGSIRRLRGLGPHATQDDLVALVADDALQRAQNLGLTNGPISEVTIGDLEAEDCHSFLRLASVHHGIERIDVERVRGGCEACAVNMDALRYCAVPLFVEGDGQFPHGAGFCRDIHLRDFQVHRTRGRLANPLILLETRVHDFRMEKFSRDLAQDAAPNIPTLRAAHLEGSKLLLMGLERRAAEETVRDFPSARLEPIPPGFLAPSCVQLSADLKGNKPFVFNGSSFEYLEIHGLAYPG
ncbi:MAG: glycosyl hydrolase family 28-related protein [Verrucomicrobiia bacterium]